MTHRKSILAVSVITLLASAILLITGSPFLVAPILDDPYLPWGTISTWAGLVALPLSIYLGFRRVYLPSRLRYRNLARALIVLITLAVFWVPVSYLLAGNLSFSFTEKATFQGGQTAMRIFWIYSATLVILPLVILILFGIFRLADLLLKRGN